MLWLKAFHVVFVVTWFAGLFYLPRLFVYHAEATDPAERGRLKVMERRLLMITHIGAVMTAVFGLATLAWWVVHAPGYFAANHWLHAKLTLVVLLYGYHGSLASLTRQFATDQCTRSSRWLRIYNEVPGLLLVGIVILVIVRPF
ncbi:CopD family protein [Tahibacter amnicola]|uniref:Protoporphyrinogen IX oxidase n=1 Tax=Tahibacter amnicola TaxID=2976241 RepID=A0ABY6BFR1_9GAMM|nr:CopD family protein [Tahibacter amnicola]UXI68098.1 CopD family protein [Tahibacter amnicola]